MVLKHSCVWIKKGFEVAFGANRDLKMPVSTDESTSREVQKDTEQLVEDLGKKQKKEKRKRQSKLEEKEARGDAPERKKKKKKKNKSMKNKKDERRSLEEEDIEQAIDDLKGYRQNREKRKNREEEEEEEEKDQNDKPEIKKKKNKKNKHKDQQTKEGKQRSVGEEDIEKLVKDFSDNQWKKEMRKIKGEVEVQNDAPKKKKRKHKTQESKENKQSSVEGEEDKEKHVENFSGYEKVKETRTRKEEVEVQNDAPKKKKRKHKTQESKENKQSSVEGEEDKEKHVKNFSGYEKVKENRKRKEEVEVQNDAPKKKKKKYEIGKQFEGDQVKEKRNRSSELEEMHVEGELGHEHQRNKKKKNKKGEKEIQNVENNNKESVKEKSKSVKVKSPEVTESTENQRLLEEVPDQRDKVKPKKSKKKNTKAHPKGGLPFEEDINPIHFDWVPSKEIKQKFKMRQGKWTKQEEKILRENMEQYLLENNLDNPSKLIFPHLHGDSHEAKKWKEFAKTTDFYRKLGKGLNRSIFLIYRKVLRSYDEENYLGAFTESEDRELEKLVSIYGRKWEKNGRIMGRSGYAVCHRYNYIFGTRGKWKESEVDLLKEAVRKVTNTTEGEEAFTNINWSAVASAVETRNAQQCRDKWLDEICWKECVSAPYQTWNWKDDLKLIKLVYESSVTNECEIDWCELQKHIEKSRSPKWLSTKFKILLRKYCNPIYLKNTDFEDVIDFLYNVKGQELKDKYGDHQDPISE